MKISSKLIEEFLKLNNPMVNIKGNPDSVGMIDCDLNKKYLTESEFIYYFCSWIEERTKENEEKESKSR